MELPFRLSAAAASLLLLLCLALTEASVLRFSADDDDHALLSQPKNHVHIVQRPGHEVDPGLQPGLGVDPPRREPGNKVDPAWNSGHKVAPALERKRPTGYVEYLTSTGLNVVLAAPHGGSETPSEIPDRDAGCWDGTQCVWSHTCGVKDVSRCEATTVMDAYTAQLTRELRLALCARLGACPAAILNLLHRRKLDANRPEDEAAFEVPLAVEAYEEFQRYVRTETGSIRGRGLFIDIHGHSHALQAAELGYLLTSAQLNSPTTPSANLTSIRALASHVGGDFDQLLRGPRSFGAFLEAEGFAAVPSPTWRGPGANAYFSGGYNTREHGSVEGGLVDAIQIESARSFRDPPMRSRYVTALVNAIEAYLRVNYGTA